jgi:hypothetical protein
MKRRIGCIVKTLNHGAAGGEVIYYIMVKASYLIAASSEAKHTG